MPYTATMRQPGDAADVAISNRIAPCAGKRILRSALLLAMFLATGSAFAAAGMYTYVVVLHDRVAAGEAPEPQVAAPDGEVLHRFENQRVVRVTAPAARALAEHPEVRYVQRVQVAGEVPPLPQSVGGAARTIAANDWAPPTWASGDYVYDGEGNIIAIGTAANPASDGGNESYAYDSAGRLVSASIAHGTTQSEQYTYDSFGNLVATTRTAGPSTFTPASLATNRLTNATYDDAGHVTASESGTTEYQYDSFNMLRAKATSTSTALYVYTADDERVGVYENSEQRWMIRDLSGKVLREWRDAGLVWLWREDYVYRNGSLAAAEREPAEGGTRHYHLDHLGTPRLITDPASMKISVHDYFPFGVEKTDFRQEMLERGTKWPEDMKFTGHERDFSGGIASDNRNQLDYMHARYYAPVWGRFLSVDPGRDWDLHEPQSWNMYAYVRNNPVNATDPTGRNIYKTTWRVLKYIGQEGKVVARIAENSKNKVMKRITGALDSIDTRGGAKRVVIAENPEARDTMTRQLSDSGKMRGPEKSGIYPEHTQAADGKYADVHLQTVDDAKAAGFGKGLLSIVAATSMAAGASEDATAGEVVSAALWDVAKAIDPLFITDAIEHATGLDEYEEERVRDVPPQ